MRLVIADDHALFREGLRCLLELHGHEVVGQAADGAQAVELARRERPDVVLMDLGMPRVDGIEATRRLTAEMPDVKVVIVTAAIEDRSLFASIQAGALGYVVKGTDSERFLEMLEAAVRGEPALAPTLARKLLEELRRPTVHNGRPAAPGELTARETDVLEAMVDGHTTNSALAERLQVSVNTVKFHVRNILAKLQLTDRTQAVAYVLRNKLVDLPPDPESA